MDAALNVENLTKQYTHFKLGRVSFSVPKGTIMGLIGENGAAIFSQIDKAEILACRKDDYQWNLLRIISDTRYVRC